ncbi:hypothetical protein F5144DRAFT_22275 [Chaetomium tenue]|uniref:Uncharacterized protein n=1 Tax=Chaetomium tenue TaxID=1854479 RepID=A0ACB7PN91_9PEZI|nr:hypothetical protein F5144DRAFT_22275 [Chaetomium globosum]
MSGCVAARELTAAPASRWELGAPRVIASLHCSAGIKSCRAGEENKAFLNNFQSRRRSSRTGRFNEAKHCTRSSNGTHGHWQIARWDFPRECKEEGKLAVPAAAVPRKGILGTPGSGDRANESPPWPSNLFRQYSCGSPLQCGSALPQWPLPQMKLSGDPGRGLSLKVERQPADTFLRLSRSHQQRLTYRRPRRPPSPVSTQIASTVNSRRVIRCGSGDFFWILGF